MDNDGIEPDPAGPPPQRIGGDAGSLLALTNGILAGVGGVYLTTRSVTITVIAGCVAVVLAGLIIAKC